MTNIPIPAPEEKKLSEQEKHMQEYQDRWGPKSQEEIFAEYAKANSERYKDCKNYSDVLEKMKEDEKLKDLHERLTKNKPVVSTKETQEEQEKLDTAKEKNKKEQEKEVEKKRKELDTTLSPDLQKKTIDLQADIDKKKVDLKTQQTALNEKKEKVENIEKKLNTVKSGEKPEEPKQAEKKKFDPEKNWIRKGLSPITATVSGVVGAIPKVGSKLLSTVSRPQDIFTKTYWKNFWKQEADHGAKTWGPKAESGKRIKTPLWFTGKVIKGPAHGIKTAFHAIHETAKGVWKRKFPYTATKHSWKKMVGWDYQGGEKIEEKK